ncbi:hypothetical protein [Pantoea agglomerans]|uniref:hypothetical protein n=1 Tax=Enterobacter agglomerans TaxID=549 RepID=UPI003DA10472
MININLLDDFSCEFLNLMKNIGGDKFQNEKFYLAEGYSIADSIQRDINNINISIELFIKARNNNDELAMQAALLHIRTFMMGVYGVFYQTVEDIDHFLETPKEINFPADYKIPEHYNYPLR